MVKILIVDDDVVSRMVLMHLIDGAGGGPYEVLEAEDGEDAWRRIDAGAAPSLVFCDLRMPHLSGMELLARLKADARYAALPFVLASAAGDAATMEQALGLGADGYIVKPFDAAKVVGELARLLVRDAAPQTQEAAEAPEATARRLGIDLDRLALYFGGLQRQLTAAGPDVEGMIAAGRTDAARAALGRLGEGCRTLGLTATAAELAGLAEGSTAASAAASATGAGPGPTARAAADALARALAGVRGRLAALQGVA